jgi:thiosulfate dehydrogenase
MRCKKSLQYVMGITMKKLYFSLSLVVLLLLFGAWLVSFFQWTSSTIQNSINTTVTSETVNNATGSIQSDHGRPLSVVFNPPAPEDAPAKIRKEVMLGYKIMTETKKYAGEYVGDHLSCTNCHFDGGRARETLSLVGVAAKYPAYRGRRAYTADLGLRTQGCFERSMNGKAPALDSQIIQSLMVYYHWISKGIPIYENVPWLGIDHDLKLKRKPDVIAGKKVFHDVCARCHGNNGHGTEIAPPLWGEHSFNDGAGMNRVRTFSVFTWRFMPKSSPGLSKDQALDVAGYVHAQPRPHFVATHPNKIKRITPLEEEDVR